jgi:ABC-type glycerol-3-phosphate transport system permease component
VADYILLHGRSLWNTLVYCALAITLALTVNPLAAYALSRYKLPSTYKILLFCMATMAFPAAVTMIPNFLLLKQLGLLNTYAALVLPGMANGFSIFLLKGFFDSLPRELYECAQIDGAGEWTMFWTFTMALSKPILAVLALGAFTVAYGNFMLAFILCPDEKMWTLMVFLYQLQIDGHTALTFAALLMAAIPTFLVFVFCQNIIIRGIVVPVEK